MSKSRIAASGLLIAALAVVLWLVAYCEFAPSVRPSADVADDRQAGPVGEAFAPDAVEPAQQVTPEVVPEPLEVPIPAAAPSVLPVKHDVSVRLVDEAGQPVIDAQVWLAQGWHRLDQLPLLAGVLASSTDIHGTARFRVSPGRHFVHVHHEGYVCPISKAYGNGGNAVLDVPSLLHSELLLRSIWVVAYQLEPSGKPLGHWVQGSGANLRRESHPSTVSALERAARTIEDRFPGSSAEAYFQAAAAAETGDFDIRVVWSGRTPSVTPTQPVKWSEFRSPVQVGFGDSRASIAFGTVFVQVSRQDGRSVDSLRLIAKRRPVRGETNLMLDSLAFRPAIVSGEPCSLPSGTYDLASPSHPFLGAELRAAGPIEVTANSFVSVPIVIKAPLVKVALQFSLPGAHRAGTHVGSIRRVSSGEAVEIAAGDLEDSRSWDLPVGDYQYELGMFTRTPTRTVLYGRGTFEVAVGAEPVRITIPLEEHEVGSMMPATRR